MVPSFKFLGILIGFRVSCASVLGARLVRLAGATNSFWGYYRILARSSAPIKQRLSLFSTFVTSKRRWMSPAVRPLVSIGKMLKTLHTNFLMSIIRLPRDCFMTGVSNWVSRRRGVRMIAQILHHHSWEGIQAQAFCTYWGHASRIHLYRYSPISAAIRIRDARWACRACINTKRQPGNWPNACKFLQTLWNKARPFGSPHWWDDASLDRHAWRELVNSWLSMRNLRPSIYYEHLQHVDLHGRCLLQVGDSFKLLPMKHLPVEDPYPLPLVLHLSPCAPR